jgi:DNA-binding SARP family transcriptional activator
VLEFRILGPLEALAGRHAVPLGGPKQRALLAILLLNANRTVSVDRLVDDLWGERPPGTATHSVEVYVSQLRKALGDRETIVTQRPGYRLVLDPGALDLHRFENLVAEGREALSSGAAETADARLREALGLWRGPALDDFAFEAFAQPSIARLEELRLGALEERIDADLALGGHAEVVAELEELVERHPLRERPRGQLMLALYRSGRQADALEAYAATRRVLVEELGIEPSPSLQRLERAILNQEQSLEWSPRETLERQGPAPGRAPAVRSILLVTRDEGELEDLVRVAEPLARCAAPHELILLRVLGRSGAGRLAEETTRLQGCRDVLVRRGVRARIAAFTTEDVGADVVRLATQQDVDLLLLDSRGASPVSSPGVATVLAQAPCDVALLFGGDPDASPEGPVLVPFGGGEHDWSALELGAWLATGTEAPLRLCGAAADRAGGRRDASRLLATASLVVQQLAGVAAEPVLTSSTVEGVASAAEGARAIVLGFSDRWPAEGLGETRPAIAAAVSAPCIAVRRGLRPGGLSPPESATRFTWSLAAARADVSNTA